jgi:hypothetical protein
MRQEAKTGKGSGTEVSRPAQRELAPEGGAPNFFTAYGNQVSNTSIVGTLLKFNKGDWLAGEAEEDIAVGTKMVANMDQLMVGWIKWQDNKPVEQIMGAVTEGYQPPRRSTLGSDDEANWELDNTGKARDPWQFSNYLVLKSPGRGGDLLTFATSSKGGLGAIGELCRAYGEEMRTHPDDWPVVELGVSSYNHSNKEFGRIKIPVLKLVGWEPKSNFTDEPEPVQAKNGGGRAKSPRKR